MRGLGTSLILIALVAVQVPFVTCHSDCRSDYLHLLAFAGHHCHDAEEVVHEHVHGCACGHTHADHPDDGEDHESGDHEVVFAVVGSPPDAPTLAWDQHASLEILLDEVRVETPPSVTSVVEPLYIGPPGRPALETVRLLL